jgi:FdhE protein
MSTRILEPGQIEQQGAGTIVRLRLPAGPEIFGERAQRLRQLAPGSAIADYLRFVARIAEQQQTMARALEGTPLPDPQSLARCREHGMAPLAPGAWRRDARWRWALRSMLPELQAGTGAADAPVIGKVITQLRAASDDYLEAQASKIVSGTRDGLDLAGAPLIAAALQALWTSLASRLAARDIGAAANPGRCPVCASPPVASIVRIGAEFSGHRYLHCCLCASQWHLVRVKCSHCDSTAGIAYQGIEGGDPAVKAETCEACRSYLKIVSMEKNPDVEPTADDLASLALDLLVGEENYACSGTNMMLFHGPA